MAIIAGLNLKRCLMRKMFLILLTCVSMLMASSTTSLKSPLKAFSPFEKKLWGSLECPKDYNLTQQLLVHQPGYFKNLDYPASSYVLGDDYVDKRLDVKTLTLLVENGLDLNEFTSKYVQVKAKEVMAKAGYETYGYALDYKRLKVAVKTLLQEHNITEANYYEPHRYYERYFLEQLAIFHKQPLLEIKWFIDHGYTTNTIEMNRAFLNAIQYKDVAVVTAWQAFEKLGGSFKTYQSTPVVNQYFEYEHESFMNLVVSVMMSYHEDDFESLQFLIDAGLDINAKDSYDHTNTGNLLLSENIEVAKKELAVWMGLGLDVSPKYFWSIPQSTLIQISNMNLSMSTEAKRVLEQKEEEQSEHTSYLKIWLMLLIYSPAILIIVTVFFIILLIVLVKSIRKSKTGN